MTREAKLLYRMPDGQAHEVRLAPGVEIFVGRHPACTITVGQPSVSRKHARIWTEAGGFFIEDLGSSNGTFVNNQRVTRAGLTDGDELRCGDFKIAFTEVRAAIREVAEPPMGGERPRVVGTLKPRRPSSDPALSPEAGRPTVMPSRPLVAAAAVGQTAPPPANPVPAPVASVPIPAPRPMNPAPVVMPAPVSVPAPISAPVAAPRTGAMAAAGGIDLTAEVARLRQEVESWRALAESRAQADGHAAGELGLLRAELERARQEVARSAAERARFDSEIADLRSDLEDRVRRIGELEAASLRAEEQVETLTDRSLKLKEQVQAQQGQLEEYRRERVDLEVQLGETRERLNQLLSNQEVSAGREMELSDQVNDLKREVRQKEKAQKEVERQLEVAEYNLRATRDENENLRLALGEDDGARRGLNQTVDHLRQVLAEKEAMIDQLQTEVARWQLRAEQKEGEALATAGEQLARVRVELAAAQERANDRDAVVRLVQQLQVENQELRGACEQLQLAARSGGDDRAALQRQLQQMQGENQQLRAALEQSASAAELVRQLQGENQQLRELVQQVRAEATEAERRSGGGRNAMEQVNELRRANRDLKNEIERLQAQGPVAAAPVSDSGELADLRRAFEAAQSARRNAEVLKERAEAEARTLRAQVEAGAGRAAPAAAPAAANDGLYAGLKGETVRLYEIINDVASEIRNGVELMSTYLSDLKPVVELVQGLPADALPPGIRERVTSVVREADPAVTLESAEEVLGGTQQASETFKRSMRTFREVLQRHGYGS